MTSALPSASVILSPRLTPILQGRLSVMMLLQYAIQGAWLPLLYTYLTKYRLMGDIQVGWLGAVGAVGAVVSPFVAGQLADRYMNAERFLALAHFAGAVAVWLIADVSNFYGLLVLSFLYGVLYTPTLGTANAIAFAHLPDRDRDFGKVRVWGTVGWICVGIGIGQWLLHQHTPAGLSPDAVKAEQVKGMADAFRLSAVLGLIQGLYAFTLPKTPPKREKKSYAPGEALVEIKRQPLVTIFLISIPIAAVHAFFFARTADFLLDVNLGTPDWINKIFGVGGAGLMTVGQVSELIVLGLMPFVVTRLPKKVILTIGLLAYAARFAIFAYLPYAWAIIPGLALHGIVFGCFFFVCFMIVDEFTTKDVRSSAQNLFNLIVFGAGVIIGNLFAGWLAAWTRHADGKMNWMMYYSIPMWVTLGCLVALLVFYPNKVEKRQLA